MALPLPRVVADVGPGGSVVTGMRGANALEKSNLENQYYAPNIESEINSRNALTNKVNTMTPLEAKELMLKNSFYPSVTNSEINNRNALTNKYNTMTPLEAQELAIKNKYGEQREQADIRYKNMGGGRGSTGSKDEMQYQMSVAQDNPDLSEAEQREAANVYAQGGDTLANGKKLAPMSDITGRALDRAVKSTSSSKLITAGVQANQADAELKALNDHVTPVIKDVGTTYFNKSIDTLAASLGGSKASQEKLGRIIGARSLQYAIAQLRNRIDMGEAGINATQELMQHSGQTIDFIAPRITPAARSAANDFINAGVKKALDARNKYGIGARSATGMNSGASQKITKQHVTEENIQQTMKETGYSREKVMSLLKEKGLV